MIRFLVSAALFFAAAAVGLLVADVVLDDMSVTGVVAFLVVVVIFALAQAVLAPFIFKVTQRNAPALVGGIGLITTFVALLVTTLVTDGLVIDGAVTWLWATLIVWIATMLASLVLPVIFAKRLVDKRRDAAAD
jgi:uncharacterized membrane protein YvlD (DUF360 family)